MEINLIEQRPSALPAVCVAVTHGSPVGRFGAWMPTTKVRRLAPVPTGGYGTSLSIDRTTAVNQFAGAARGVPPRGKPD